MSIDRIIMIIAGSAGILLTYWFFLMKQEKSVMVSAAVDILVKGGYTPASITVKRGQPTTITFIRDDPSSCLEDVVLPDFKIRRRLPLNERVSVTIIPENLGEFRFSCGMGMFHGTIVVA